MSGPTDAIRVLHVDDMPDFTELVATFLEREDDRFSVKTASSVDEAESILEGAEFDCIISDYELAERNGIEFLEIVRTAYPNLPFILYTGKGSEEVASEAISSGVTDYLQKEGGTSQYTVLANRVANAVEQNRSKNALQSSQRRLSLFIEQSPLGVIEWDENFEINGLNESAEDILGYTEDELVGRTWNTLVSNADEALVDEVVQKLLDDQGGYHSVNENVTKEGEVIICEWHNRVVTDEDDDVVAIFSQFQDITERKTQQKELERHRAIIQAAKPTIVTIDETNTILSVNPSVKEMFGYDPDEITGQPLPILMSDETAQRHTEALERYIETDEKTLDWNFAEFEGQHNDGSPVPLSVTLSEVTYEGERYFVGILRDRSDQQAREQRLEALNEMTREVVTANSTKAVAEIGVNAASEILGLEANAIHLFDDEKAGLAPVAATDALYDLIGELPTFTGDESIAWRVYENGEPLALDDVHDDPDVFNSNTPVRSEVYFPIGESGILVAGSSSPEAFDQEEIVLGEILAANIATALDQVNQTEQLRHREDELSRQNERLEEFASAVSHDLRNPLNVASAHLELLRDEYESEHIDAIARAQGRMADLIEDLLVLAQEGDQMHEMEAVDFEEIAQNSWHNVSTAEATLNLNVHHRFTADRSRLQQLLENLFRNAVEHGGDAVTITVGDLEDGFYVEDNGGGIPDDDQEKVLSVGYSTTEGGSGFGLSIVKQVADTHGWDITVTNGTEGGARFEISSMEVLT